MKKIALIISLLFILLHLQSKAQSRLLDFYLIDQISLQPINNAHIFLVNTTFGAVSTPTGQVTLKIPLDLEEDLLISHINYHNQLLLFEQFKDLQKGDTIFLSPNNIDFSQIIVAGKRSNKWKKNLKRFKKVFLGADKAANKCRILNPEVLRFKEENGLFTATAIDLIKIRNDFLGYEIQYALSALHIEADGSTDYAGKASFTDISTQNNRKAFQKKRLETYRKSPKHFFACLINNTLAENDYEIENLAMRNNSFVFLMKPTHEILVKKRPNSKNYLVQFNEFLKIVNKNVKWISYSKVGVRAGGLESQRFSNSQAEDKTQIQYATSYLYKITPFLEVNQYGNILNTKNLKEYGFWAERKMAHQLPFDFANNYQLETSVATAPILPKKKIGNDKVDKEWTEEQKFKLFTNLIYERNGAIKTKTLGLLNKNWKVEFIPPLLEFLKLSKDEVLVQQIIELLQQKTGQNFGADFYSWQKWLWDSTPAYQDYYADFKGEIYQHLDPKFKTYFHQRAPTASIRLDEILWGGVEQDGIPPLHQPKMIPAAAATYLEDNHIVFALYINGVAKAYPKRILAWHEFFTDQFGDMKIAGVYCTLCGTVIAYNQEANGTIHDLGTSGFLYRSNKLMYDEATQSLWSTIEGKPVLGPLVNKGIQLATYPIITTTWKEWKQKHPNTKVLALETGFQRNYEEGIAYQTYFATDDLMFPVPSLDKRLPNKATVLVIRWKDYKKDPIAISIDYLKRKKWFLGNIDSFPFIVLADKTGAARAYEVGNITFKSFKRGMLKDDSGNNWTIHETHLTSSTGQQLQRIPAHNAFWFAWLNAQPNTRLVK